MLFQYKHFVIFESETTENLQIKSFSALTKNNGVLKKIPQKDSHDTVCNTLFKNHDTINATC